MVWMVIRANRKVFELVPLSVEGCLDLIAADALLATCIVAGPCFLSRTSHCTSLPAHCCWIVWPTLEARLLLVFYRHLLIANPCPWLGDLLCWSGQQGKIVLWLALFRPFPSGAKSNTYPLLGCPRLLAFESSVGFNMDVYIISPMPYHFGRLWYKIKMFASWFVCHSTGMRWIGA